MYLMDEVIAEVLSQAGQTYVSPSDVNFTDPMLERNFFIPSVKEYERYRAPLTKTPITVADANGYTFPDNFKTLIRITVYETNVFTNSQVGAIVPATGYELVGNVLYIAPGKYYVEYGHSVTLTRCVPEYEAETTCSGTLNVDFYIPSKARPGTIVLSADDLTAIDVEQSAGVGEFSGDLVSAGTIVYDTGIIDLTLTVALTDPISVAYTSYNMGALEIEKDDILFVKIFGSKFLAGFGAAKQVLQIDELPINLTSDELMSYGRELLAQLPEVEATHGRWWKF